MPRSSLSSSSSTVAPGRLRASLSEYGGAATLSAQCVAGSCNCRLAFARGSGVIAANYPFRANFLIAVGSTGRRPLPQPVPLATDVVEHSLGAAEVACRVLSRLGPASRTDKNLQRALIRLEIAKSEVARLSARCNPSNTHRRDRVVAARVRRDDCRQPAPFSFIGFGNPLAMRMRASFRLLQQTPRRQRLRRPISPTRPPPV